MDMAELANLTGLPVRKLRYVSDHRVLPGLNGTGTGHGVPRTFTEFEGFGIALAARMLDVGLTRKAVTSCLTTVLGHGGRRRIEPIPPLVVAYHEADGRLEVADAAFARVRVPCRSGKLFDTGWMPVGSDGPARSGFTPVVLVTVDLGRIACALQGRQLDSGQS